MQLELEFGKPRNPFINAGAIVVADILASRLENPEEDFIGFVRSISNDTSIGYNDEVALSEYSCGYLNAAIANVLKYHNNLEGDIDRVLRLYYRICSVEMTCCTSELNDAPDGSLPILFHTLSPSRLKAMASENTFDML